MGEDDVAKKQLSLNTTSHSGKAAPSKLYLLILTKSLSHRWSGQVVGLSNYDMHYVCPIAMFWDWHGCRKHSKSWRGHVS